MLEGYRRGIFPMAEARHVAGLHWIEPRQRGLLPIGGLHLSRSLARAIRRGDYEISVNRAFAAVVEACADRPETWINAELEALYAGLHAMGHAHSLEVWRDGRLIGGVFGVTLGRAFCGETMFSRATDASKIALAYLVGAVAPRGVRAVRHPVPDTASCLAWRDRNSAGRLSRAFAAGAGGRGGLHRPCPASAVRACVVTCRVRRRFGQGAAQHPDIIAGMVQRRQRRA